MNNIEGFDEYFASIETKKYNRNLINSDVFYVFENIKILISINEFNNSLCFTNLGEFKLFLELSNTFDDDNCYKTINFINRKLKSLGKEITEKFHIGFEDSF
jgi:hypothetical protein